MAISELTMGAYGWGLFVATPFLVSLITGFLVNGIHALGFADTIGSVAIAFSL